MTTPPRIVSVKMCLPPIESTRGPRRRRPGRHHRPEVQPLEGRLLLAFASIGTAQSVDTFSTPKSVDTQPDVAMANNGDYVVVWQHYLSASDTDIYFQRYFANGMAKPDASHAVATSNLIDESPQVAMAPDGRFAVTWTQTSSRGDKDVLVARFDAAGNKLGESIVPLSEQLTNDQYQSDIAMSIDGSFGVVWTNEYPPTDGVSDDDVRYRAYNASGVAITGDLAVSTSSLSDEFEPKIARRSTAADGSGTFQVITWTSGALGAYDVYFAQYATPASKGATKRASLATDDIQISPRVGVDGVGNFAIAWTSNTNDTHYDVAYRRFNAAGTAATNYDEVADNSPGTQSVDNLAMAPTGRFVIAYGDQQSGTPTEKFVEVSPFGVKSNPKSAIPYAGSTTNAQVAILAPGNRLVVVLDEQHGSTYSPYSLSFQQAAAPGDYDGDGKTDLAVYGYGRLAFQPSSGGPGVVVPFGGPADSIVTGDYDGDGKTDLAVYGYGRLAFIASSTGAGVVVPFGGPADSFFAADYDGDGKTDLAVYGYGRLAFRPSTGGADVVVPFGGPADTIVAADYDGDSKTDLAVYGYGRLAFIASSNLGGVVVPFGGPADSIVTGDYDGDGKTDPAVYGYGRLAFRPSTGGSDRLIPFGGAADSLVAPDYDGDGKTDVAVYGYGRLAFVVSSTIATVVVPFGGPDDTLLPKPFKKKNT